MSNIQIKHFSKLENIQKTISIQAKKLKQSIPNTKLHERRLLVLKSIGFENELDFASWFKRNELHIKTLQHSKNRIDALAFNGASDDEKSYSGCYAFNLPIGYDIENEKPSNLKHCILGPKIQPEVLKSVFKAYNKEFETEIRVPSSSVNPREIISIFRENNEPLYHIKTQKQFLEWTASWGGYALVEPYLFESQNAEYVGDDYRSIFLSDFTGPANYLDKLEVMSFIHQFGHQQVIDTILEPEHYEYLNLRVDRFGEIRAF